ncbi:unnamed protein product [Blepharisma stoltei]|uniref:LITAF domain-containing protein n=1 Tax=Blepharisma stoltei TaxID=1481888 RepID=A0AAU9JXE2_9CILI|nr:unnamed protein product [Blepharisma stoltei]
MVDTPQIFLRKNNSVKSSNESIDTQGSSFITHSHIDNIEDNNDQKKWYKKTLGEDFQLDPKSQSTELNDWQFEVPMKSIFPSTCYLSRSSKMHRRFLSTPPDFIQPKFLINYSKRRKNLDRNSPEKTSLSIESDKKSWSLSSEEVLSALNLKRQSLVENDEIIDSFKADLALKAPIKDVSAKKYRKLHTEKENSNHSLPALGNNPCTVYCEFCKMDVHSVVIIRNDSRFVTSFMDFFQNIFGCCSSLVWLNNMRYHRCSNCGTILGRSIA